MAASPRHSAKPDDRRAGPLGPTPNNTPGSISPVSPPGPPAAPSPQTVPQIAAPPAAQTAARQHDRLAFARHDHQVVERDFAELIDDHQAVPQPRALHQPVQQGRLAAAEKAGDQRYRQPLGGTVGIEEAAHDLDILPVRSDSFAGAPREPAEPPNRPRRDGGTPD